MTRHHRHGNRDCYCDVVTHCLCYFVSEMMYESDSPPLMNFGDEIWTEEEVIEFGLAGEEEFCDLETVETSTDIPTMPEVTESAELVYLDDVESVLPEPDVSAKKSSRVRTPTCTSLRMLVLLLHMLVIDSLCENCRFWVKK